MESNKHLKQVSTVVWTALLVSNIVIVFVAKMIVFNGADAAASKVVSDIIAGLAIIMIMASRLVYSQAKKLSTNINPNEKFNTKSFVLYIGAWALGESVSILGLLYGVMGGAKAYEHAYFFFVMAILVHLAQRPKVS